MFCHSITFILYCCVVVHCSRSFSFYKLKMVLLFICCLDLCPLNVGVWDCLF
ncbi:hypothetical protein HanIR_Chr08g0383851 [Helianthus annuus]|nr:hypothetical protein HanIR_Chr08g0383851 [Helianthus annuus]